ncbi:MAG: hypothetical protein CGW95_12940 [Phenylobacterium zucineum]|nr:MAG: hypothetical protein CGW95_12940 [Phenylobacterium zucineum]
MATYTKQMQQIVEDYRASGQPWPATARAMAQWAVHTRRWELPAAAVVSKCADDLATAMREEYYTDPKGRRVRLLHAAKRHAGGEQLTLWDDIRTADRLHMQLAFQQRRQSIVGDCRQLKVDADSYSDAHPEQAPIQPVFDFTMDLAELEAAAA